MLADSTSLTAAASPRHFIDTQSFDKTELLSIIGLARRLKDADKAGACPQLLKGVSLGMLFEAPSLRTRVSFEVAMTKLGGHALYMSPGEIHLGARESLADTARALERMVDAVEVSTLRHATLLALAARSTVPVINGLTDYNHPTQALCDVFTMMEYAPPKTKLENLHITFIGDATNVCSSLAAICTQMGMHFTQAAADHYQLGPHARALAENNCTRSGGTLTLTEDVEMAVRDAHFLYTDRWWWIGQEASVPERKRAALHRYQLNAKLLSKAPRHCRVMHCLPALRGVEATDEVLDSVQSIIFEQAGNRLHTTKALLVWLILPHLKHANADVRSFHSSRIFDYLAQHAVTN